MAVSKSDLLTDEEDAVFEMLKDEQTNLLCLRTFLAALHDSGLRKTDPRLSEMMANITQLLRKGNIDASLMEEQKVNIEIFRSIASPNIQLICNALRHELIIPEFTDFTEAITDIYKQCKNNTNGNVATYIPQLAKMSGAYWGVSICTIDGQRFSVGDVHIPFTIQSCSKPLTYGLALDRLGESVVHKYVGQEPSGRNFNELVLDPSKKPHNPMINAGAILVCSMIQALINPEMTYPEKFNFTLEYIQKLAGGEDIGFNNAVYLSEKETGDRNYALGYYMKENRCFPENASFKDCLDFYFQCCSIETTCDTLAVVASTLANGGICPLTTEKVLKPESIRDLLSLMYSCGMYDYSGQFAFKVGLPAKSGVSGCVLIVIPNIMGICTWCPALDTLGNSCRGLEFCAELVKKFNFHKYDNLRHATGKMDPRTHNFEERGLNIVQLLFCAAHGDLYALKRLKLAGMNMSITDYDGRTALHVAAAEGHSACVKFLVLNCKVPVDMPDRWGHTAITEATQFKHASIIEFLESSRK